jgi:hypothetical protein|eukprot:COSAG06_NODE_1851_length_8215_cov_39.893790_11_plen_154_part_00
MPFCAKNDRVTKTGSGQRHRETSNRDAFSYSVIDAMSSAIEGAAAMLYGVSESYKESANCRCAKRPCFPLKCFVMNRPAIVCRDRLRTDIVIRTKQTCTRERVTWQDGGSVWERPQAGYAICLEHVCSSSRAFVSQSLINSLLPLHALGLEQT